MNNEEVIAHGGVCTSALPSPLFRRDLFLGLMLILFVILAYAPIWHAGFVWDDDAMLAANPCVVGPLGLKEIWTTNAADICPLVITTFWIEHALWGLAPLPYHLVNIVLHGACAVLLWRVLRRLRVQGVWLGVALWALHPVQVESVAWITEMKNTESALFFLLSILFFVRFLTAKELNGRKRGGWDYVLSLLCAALAMASKSSTVILPVVVCLCAWWVEGGWHWRRVARVVPMFLMSAAASALSLWTEGLQLATAADPQWMRTWPQRLAAAGDAVWFYLGKLLWPDPLITIYPRWQIDAASWVSYLPLLAVIVLFCFLWLNRRSGGAGSRACLFAFAYFLTALLPVLGLIDTFIFRFSLVFDHFQYLASMGPLALAGAGLARSADYFLFWMAHNNQGVAFFQRGKLDDALAQFQKAVELNPNYADAHTNLGIALLQKGQLDKAIEQHQTALKINPNFAIAHANLAVAFIRKGRIDDAIAEFQEALRLDANLSAVRETLEKLKAFESKK